MKLIIFKNKYILVAIALSFVSASCSDQDVGDDLSDEAKNKCPADVVDKWWCEKNREDYPTHWHNEIAAIPTGEFRQIDDGILDYVPADINENNRETRAIRGRNTWLLWTAGNQAFWDYLARHGYGLVDYLKILDNRVVDRADRFKKMGLINEPGMRKPASPNSITGLLLDVPVGWDGEWPPVNHNEYRKKYPQAPDPYVYGYSSGIVGLRIFPNPYFNQGKDSERARNDWDAEKYLTDLDYVSRPDLVRPYRVGMSCAFCHISFNPVKPPVNTAEPEWRDLLTTIGNQYYKFGKTVGFDTDDNNIFWHIVNYSKSGTVDTSLIPTDGINNPNIINSLFNIQGRLEVSKQVNPELISKDSAQIPVINGLGLPESNERHVMHVLAGGADSVGTRAALARVYLNIGTFHQEWIRKINVLIGIKKQKPFKINKAARDSVYWQVTLHRMDNLFHYFNYQKKQEINNSVVTRSITEPKKLVDAPGGKEYILNDDDPRLMRGKEVFATHCLVCHSSKQPEFFWKNDPADWKKWIDKSSRTGSEYLEWAKQEVRKKDFLEGNYLSTDQRYKVTDIGVNMSVYVSDNAMPGHVWEDFSSIDFKNQEIIPDKVYLQHPYRRDKYIEWSFSEKVGPGRARPPTLVNIWSTAPFLHNNSLGEYPPEYNPDNPYASLAPDVSVTGRMKVFTDSANKLLGLEGRRGFDSIVRTTADSKIIIKRVFMLDTMERELGVLSKYALIILTISALLAGVFLLIIFVNRIYAGKQTTVKNLSIFLTGTVLFFGTITLLTKDTYSVGYIPEGTPVSILTNITSPGWYQDSEHKKIIVDVAKDLFWVWWHQLPSLDHEKVPDLVNNLIKLNKSPDFVLDHGHEFGYRDVKDESGKIIMEKLSVSDRQDLIEFLKTM